ncbi:MAG: glycosyltransferase [Gammaproteobacteria bacterium]|nr:glycosyltransferase [Gammaproteobacteria bacterium]NIR81913.1 glycosyltransferase [Gammaproteobacteria bacterium]NIR88745.1 glycosyltransferase [Gammaproteobacteria bacterium]NIU03021.1 glycosyltransferase [Gammaproteobacteria bacterium]NIV50542.1 glycosyltransferase [Gammaproteobacteria bacterium]
MPQGRAGVGDEAAERSHDSRRVAVLVPSMDGGGAERSMFNLCRGLIARGHRVDMLVCRTEGNLNGQVPAGARFVALRRASTVRGRIAALRADPGALPVLARPMLLPWKSPWSLRYLPALARYLGESRPDVLLAGIPFFNLIALWARRRSGVDTRVVVTERSTLSVNIAIREGQWRRRFLPPLLRRTYAWADAIVAVSNGVADDLARATRIPRERIRTVYNPVVTPDLHERAKAPLAHPWFAPGMPPVILGVGEFVESKDFPTLFRAFARVRRSRPARLVILGKGKPERHALVISEVERLGIGRDVDLPGWVDNPFAYMARASVFVLSSIYEGLPGVLIQALACGCPVVSTDCQSGPAEILSHGRYGRLVAVGDDEAMAQAISETLDAAPDRARLRARGAEFSIERVLDDSVNALFG